ncbi:Atlastin [Papilio machaon]|uniref:Atlastin n=1 Tax=Papilio machaon TaxID=76193 RepID=A0A194RHK2_PAPMA|nr:Atlastin [Papilio machaon]
MQQESIVSTRPDREITKKIITPGDYSIVPYEESRCKIVLSNVTNTIEDVERDVESRILSKNFDGVVIIGEADSFIDKDFELILQQMCCGETCLARIVYKNQNCEIVKEISCEIELKEVTEEQLVSDWSWTRLFEAAAHHKERGVALIQEKRVLDAFRRFSKAFKFLVAIEPVNPEEINDESLKEIKDLKVKLYNNLAHCQLQFCEYEAVLDLCNRAITLDNDNVKALYRRCTAYHCLKMYEDAWKDIQRRGLQIVSPKPDHTFELDERSLTELLDSPDVRNRSVVLVAVAGAFRKGKSFLLDFFLRYLHHTYVLNSKDENWLGPEDEPLQGFGWRGGSERHTTGLLLWSQPFKATLENGEKVAIFLMDTQGTFDSESTVRDNATVFALSTMISSVLIYNLSQNIEEDELQHLQNLQPKVLSGQTLKAKELLYYIKAYMEVFNGTELPVPQTILEATAQANNLSAVSEAREVYEALMEEVAGGARPYLPPDRLAEEHRRARDKALHCFHNKKKMGGDAKSEIYREQLVQELEEQFDRLRAQNESKSLLNIIGSGVVFAALLVAGCALSMLGDALAFTILEVLGQALALLSLGALAVWTYSRCYKIYRLRVDCQLELLPQTTTKETRDRPLIT